MYIEIVKKDGGFFTHGQIINHYIAGNFLIVVQLIIEGKTMNRVFPLEEISYFKIYENENK